jgi:methylated-DNA-protein-cysteine methyltransferase-like protein
LMHWKFAHVGWLFTILRCALALRSVTEKSAARSRKNPVSWSTPHSVKHGNSEGVALGQYHSQRKLQYRLFPFTICHVMAKNSGWSPVYKLVKQIPRGRVTTYGSLARALRLRGGARAAGRALAATPKGKGIPWHRVVGHGGKLLIREPYASLQRKLLESEGATVLEARVKMAAHEWKPAKKKTLATKVKSKKISDKK